MNFIHEELINTEAVSLLSRNGVRVYTLRTDKIHPVISGNKWFKLKYYLQEAIQQGKKNIITFGGAYSNHIVATAAACAKLGLKSVGIIRGEAPKSYSHTLRDAQHFGMELHFISRSDYKNKTLPNKFLKKDFYIIAEGGYGIPGAAGAATIQYDKESFCTVVCAVGTGTMLAGLINARSPNASVTGISVMKNNFALEDAVRVLLIDKEQDINIFHDYHFGGYAKYNRQLIGFMNELYENTGIATDFVYSGKLFYAVNDLVRQGFFEPAKPVLVIHCGGLQGNLSLPKGTLMF